MYYYFGSGLTIFNMGAYLTIKSIFHNAITLIYFDSWNQPVLSKEGKFSWSRKQLKPLIGFEPRLAIHCASTNSYNVEFINNLVYN